MERASPGRDHLPMNAPVPVRVVRVVRVVRGVRGGAESECPA